MPNLSDLKEKAEELCPYPLGKWINTKFDPVSRFPDNAFAYCIGHKGVAVSVIVRPPEGAPHIALVSDSGNTIPLVEDKADVDAEQLELFEGE
jgi:hypothetical protein